MPTLLVNLLRPLALYLAAAAVLLGAVLYVVTLRHELAASQEKAAQLAAVNIQNVAAVASYRAQEARWNAAVSTLDARTQTAAAAAARIAARVDAAPPSDNAPAAPVLSHALDDLRVLQGAAP